ncbi:hypothetical protein PMAYCL1PPCAC_24301 [Pristionchus mayeri]|uniref:Transmembrane protein 98 n=1 Tax=Pristionchus mayeri TaxID=1317129 RepID=A0AAN5I8E6_9BILA|nr:hypothetical protein PMAYCL1PPCAC_24301 [Pristionchus mayeri]
MDLVVWFALGTLAVIFFLALVILIALIWRRHQQKLAFNRADTFIFKKTRDDQVDKLVELAPLLNSELDKREWGDGEEAPFSDVIAILKLTTEVVKILSEVGLTRASSKIYEVIAQAMFRVDTHFHELLEFVPSSENDIRVIEARALTLTTTVWSLNAAFTLHGFEQAKEVEDKVIEMYSRVDKLRQQCPDYAGRRRAEQPGGEEHEDKTELQATDEVNDSPPSTSTAFVQHLPSKIEVQAEVNQLPVENEETASSPCNGDEAVIASPPYDNNGSPSKPECVLIATENGSPRKTFVEEISLPKSVEDGVPNSIIPQSS